MLRSEQAMLYVVSGTSRSGKTMIAKRILKLKGIPYLSLDWIVMGFTNGMPECGIHDKLFPNEIAEKLQTFFESMCANMLWTGEDYVIEGEAVLPESARSLLNSNPEEVAVCFLGYPRVEVEEKVRQVKTFNDGDRDWLTNESDDVIERHIENMVQYSRKIEKECAEYNVRYFDTSNDLMGTVDQATHYMLDEA